MNTEIMNTTKNIYGGVIIESAMHTQAMPIPLAVALTGFDEAEADNLRKVIAKKAGGEKLGEYQKQFFEGCHKNDVIF